ncbi:MAG: TauD/TfdA family dioxygenase, partial [Chromatiales bacterium]|nr:TauD/TfdA family dioxygenase [Chromatiales bacterium]
DCNVWVDALEARPDQIPAALDAAQGLLVLPGLKAIGDDATLLLRLSRLFGAEVENYRETNIAQHMVHATVPEILQVSNAPPVSRPPPALPDPPRNADGSLPVQFPHRVGWHSDQSYRRPPPDVSLFFAQNPCPQGQGQTLYASGIAAYAGLPERLAKIVEDLQGLHAQPGKGRSEAAALAGETPPELPAHQRPQSQPVVRVHPVTGERALYLCERGQMDWFEGPFVGMEPGPKGAGAKLLYELMAHMTRPQFVYVHEWSAGDLIVYDNRTVSHSATWFDTDSYDRMMWRTTVSGNPGTLYDGELKSWLPTMR